LIRNIYILLLLSLSFGTVTDIDGNVYEIVEVDEQLCMTDNLKGTHYIDDTEIPNLVNRSTDSYGVYNNDPINAEIYGNLYNGYQVNEVICYDENPLSIEEYNDLKLQHNNVRDLIEIGYFLNRDIIQVPVVFHNLYKIVDDMPINSYCDFISDNNYTTGNDQNLCNEMVLRTLEIINSQYANVGVEFVLHPYYPEMLHATDPGFDGFLENATGSNLPTSEDIKEHYNIPNPINIYTAQLVNGDSYLYDIQ